MEHDMIMLDKHGDDDHDPDSWTHYRITSTTGLGIPEGELGSSIQVSRLRWPTLEDIGSAIDNIGMVGYANAYRTVNDALWKQWGIGRERSIFIGVRDRYSESGREELRRKGFKARHADHRSEDEALRSRWQIVHSGRICETCASQRRNEVN